MNRYLFSLVRICTGLYGLFFFAQLLAYPELVISQSLPFLSLIPELFLPYIKYAPWAGLAASLFFALGLLRRAAAFCFWATLALSLAHNTLLREVQFDYLGWLLWLYVFVPEGEPLSFKPRVSWECGHEFYLATLLTLGSSYTLSGISKLLTPEWNSGAQVAAFYHLGFASDPGLSHANSAWAVSLVETAALPLLLWRPSRPWIWLALMVGQAGLATTRLNHISVFMLLFQLLLLDPKWWRRKEAIC